MVSFNDRPSRDPDSRIFLSAESAHAVLAGVRAREAQVADELAQWKARAHRPLWFGKLLGALIVPIAFAVFALSAHAEVRSKGVTRQFRAPAVPQVTKQLPIGKAETEQHEFSIRHNGVTHSVVIHDPTAVVVRTCCTGSSFAWWLPK